MRGLDMRVEGYCTNPLSKRQVGVLKSNRLGKYEITEEKYMTKFQTNDTTEEIKQIKNEENNIRN